LEEKIISLGTREDMGGTTHTKERKEEVINAIKSEGITGAEAGRRYGISVKNIYRWLAEGTGGSNSQLLEINRIKRENASLKQIIGELMLERGKKS
jgi:transposase-like protein